MFTPIKFVFLNSLPIATQQMAAHKVSALTQGVSGEKPQMLPLAVEEVVNQRLAVVALSGEKFAGQVAAKHPITHQGDDMTEVGSLVVSPQFRRMKIASHLTAAMSWHLTLQGEVPYAFCNGLSLPIFQRAHYELATGSEIPPQAFGLCAKCSSRPDQGCCDTTVVFRPGLL